MVAVDSNRFVPGDEKHRTDKSERKEGAQMQAVEEGEASDPKSIKGSSKNDFVVPEQPKSTSLSTSMITSAAAALPKVATSDSSSRFWMGDLYKYSYPHAYAASGLYNLAWAQAVQNKPLNKVLGEFKQESDSMGPQGGMGDEDDTKVCGETNSSSMSSFEPNSNTVINDCGAKNHIVAASDDEKEEGELEEGEIDLEYELMNPDENRSLGGGFCEIGMEEEEDLEDRVLLIRKMLDNVNAKEAEKSFDVACARLRSSVESVQDLVLRCWFPTKDTLIQQSFGAFKCVNSVFCAMSPVQKEQNKGAMSRLITYASGLHPALFSPEQMKEIEAAMLMISSLDISQRQKTCDGQEELPVTHMPILTDSNSLAVNSIDESDMLKDYEDDSSFSSLAKNGRAKKAALDLLDKRDCNMLLDARAPGSSNIKGKIRISPLLDLHQVHEEDGLPSPTCKTSIPLGDNHKLQVGPLVDPYESDALRAVSSYQQKFGRSSFSSFDQLPSPTPSEEGNCRESGDANEEVTSFRCPNLNGSKSSSSLQPTVSSSPSESSSIIHGLITRSMAGISGSVPKVTSQGTAKSRDPRLRYMNLDQVAVEGPAVKKQKNDREYNVIGIDKGQQTVPGNRGPDFSAITGPSFFKKSYSAAVATDPRLRDVEKASLAISTGATCIVGSGSGVAPAKTNMSVSVQSLLKDIVVNPAVWMNILKEQQKFVDPSKCVSDPANLSSFLEAIPMSGVASGMVHKTSGSAPVPSPKMSSQDESAKVSRMKPRDPRRMLHANTTKRNVIPRSEPTKIDEVQVASFTGSKDTSTKQMHANGTCSTICSETNALPDITKQFTKNLKNITDAISGPQAAPVLSTYHQDFYSEGLQQATLDDQLRFGLPSHSNNPSDEHSVSHDEGPSVAAQSSSAWSDVDGLFVGYDDQQKAAIQKERARRIDEQRKLFSDRKLGLVLDLDHTLLNSAKFSEVDPIHDELLRKKEEQDRDKQYRHLFRFPHMGMWTKLRPGIWNFLEKASKLFELHLYTMGNKLYATEMAKVLDPKGTLFAGRVISRGDDGDLPDVDDRAPKTKDLEGVLGMESGILIIDDSVRVWPLNKPNLIVVERYTYFPCSRRQFGLPGPSLLEIDHDERPDEGTLASCLAVIEKVHQNFFIQERLEDADVRNILASEQMKILAGCRILFSRVFPVGEANPHLHPLWKTAEQFGAVCTNHLDEQVTHVVAISPGTEKVNWAHSTGRYVVHPGWVEASALLYRRANELDFAVK